MSAQLATVRPLQSSIVRTSGAATVFIVDADASSRAWLEHALQARGVRVESFDSAEQFLAQPRGANTSCLIVDTDGLALQQALADCPEIPVVFVTSQRDVMLTVRAMKAGAIDFLVKPCSETAILDAVDTALDRSRSVLAQEAVRRGLEGRYELLSPREREVMALIVSGRLNKQVGAQLGISEITVKVHRGNVMRKMAADSFAQLVMMGRSLRLDPLQALA